MPSVSSRRAIALALLASSVTIACGDPTGPPEPLVVTLTSSQTFGPVLIAGGEEASIRCGFRLIATATGKGRADWQGGVFRFFAGADRTAPLDTVVLSEDELVGAWALDSVSAARADTSEWHFTAGVPFAVEFSFAYAQRGATAPDFATVRSVCGPTPSAAAGPPAASLVQVRTSDAELNVGDTVFVTYDATSANGLWQSGVAISGPFEETRFRPDTLLTTARHTIAFRVPAGSRLDLPVSVLLMADDIALERTTALHATTIRVIDRAPPVAGGYTSGGRIPSGTAFSFQVSASDDNAIRTLVWELDGEISAKDSITLLQAVQSEYREIVLTARPEWAGKRARLRVRSYDDAGQRSAEWLSADGIFRFHESFPAQTVLRGFVTSRVPDFHAYSPTRSRLYAAFSDAGLIEGIDLVTMSPLSPIGLAGAGALGVSPSGDSLFVGTRTSRTIRVLGATSGELYTTIPLSSIDFLVPPGTNPAATPDWIVPLAGGRVLVHVASVPGVVEIDLGTGLQRYRPEFEPSAANLAAFASTAGDRVLLLRNDCQRWYVVATDSLTPCQSGPTVDPRFVSMPLSGAGAGFGTRIVDGSLSQVGPADEAGMSIPDADGVHHWNADMWAGRIFKRRSVDGTIVKSTPLDGQAWLLRFLDGGRYLVVLGWGTVTRFDLGAP